MMRLGLLGIVLVLLVPTAGRADESGIQAALAATPESKVCKFSWARKVEEGPAVFRLKAHLVLEAFSTHKGVMMGRDSLMRPTEQVEVAQPENLGQVIDFLDHLVLRTQGGQANEYALFLYAGSDLTPHYLLQKGGWLVTQVLPQPVVETPDKERMLVMGVVGHTHPFGEAKPSEGDHKAVQAFGLFHQKYAVLVAPQSKWCLYDVKQTLPPRNEVRELPVLSLFPH
jgi:hypothetical protein